MANRWKPGQQKAIDWRDGELIVSASAGTGKTSVIIERAWQIVQSGQANVDELVIVTFTEDAAEELKTRFLNRLDAELSEANDPTQRAFLRDQLHRLDRAQICTIHSMCRRIVRENYNLLGIGDEVSVLPPVQAGLLKHRLMDELLEKVYADQSDFGSRFRTLVERYGGNVDANVAQTVLALHEFLNSLANPDGWREETRKLSAKYREDPFELSSLAAWQYLKGEWLLMLNGAAADFQHIECDLSARANTKANDYLESLIQLTRNWRTSLEAGATSLMETPLPRSPQMRKEEEKIWWPLIRERIDGIKEILKDVAAECDEAVGPNLRETLRKQSESIDTILEMEAAFSAELARSKDKEDQLEFDDLQRLALKILKEYPEAAKRYREAFRFVMVDEYQDINEIQDVIIRLICRPDESDPGRCANLFMVGDVKQSIYRFRQAEPEIFQRLYTIARGRTDEESENRVSRIDLADNFRSRREVLDAVNSVFTPLLNGGDLELHYDEESRLVYGANYPETKDRPTAELHILERALEADGGEDSNEENDFEEMEAINREAWLAAKKIRDLIDSKYPVCVGGELRPVSPDDIVILLRSLRNTAGTYISMLRRVGLNAYCQQIEAFLEYPEIADVVSLLTIIDNPFHDIPLATVLRSPFVGATVDELSEIRLAAGRDHFYNGLVRFVAENPLHPSGQKFKTFMDRYDHWRRSAGCSSVGELVQQIFLETHYPETILARTSEAAGTENLDEFLELGWQFSSDSKNDLRDFLDYLEMLSERSQAIPSVQAGAGSGVRLMTVHASKGLEFPVVVLGNIGKQVNLTDIRRDILIDRQLLIGLKDVEPLGLARANTLPAMAIAKRSRNQTIAEELRLLYVAMTRAKEKLIMIGTARSNTLAKGIQPLSTDGKLSPATVSGRDNALTWISFALASNAEQKSMMQNLLSSSDETTVKCGAINVSFYPSDAQKAWVMGRTEANSAKSRKAGDLLAELEKTPGELSADSKVKIDKILSVLDWRYPYDDLCRTPTHFSVTDLTQQADAFGAIDLAEGDPVSRPQSMMKSDIRLPSSGCDKSLERGTAWHKLMEKFDLAQTADEDHIRGQLESLIASHILTKEQAGLIEPYKIERFFLSEPGRLMRQYKKTLYRELPFTFLLSAGDLPPKLKRVAVEEPILIQGVIDCLLRTEAGLVIIDYKTNQIAAGEVDRLTEHYRTQLDLYARAMGEILKERVASAWLYFAEPDSAVRVI